MSPTTTSVVIKDLKGIGIEFQQLVIIFRKINTEETFLPFTVITNKDYFSRKKVNLRNLLSRYM